MESADRKYLDQRKLLAYEKFRIKNKQGMYFIDKLLSPLFSCCIMLGVLFLSYVLSKFSTVVSILSVSCCVLLYLNVLSIASICKLDDKLSAIEDLVKPGENESASDD